jgi:hypothetical protein
LGVQEAQEAWSELTSQIRLENEIVAIEMATAVKLSATPRNLLRARGRSLYTWKVQICSDVDVLPRRYCLVGLRHGAFYAYRRGKRLSSGNCPVTPPTLEIVSYSAYLYSKGTPERPGSDVSIMGTVKLRNTHIHRPCSTIERKALFDLEEGAIYRTKFGHIQHKIRAINTDHVLQSIRDDIKQSAK